jgi:hypothetical protein
VTAIELARQHLERASAGYYEWSPEVYDTLARALITATEERDAVKAGGYAPMDCPVCGRHRLEWRIDEAGALAIKCEKCTTSSEDDGFTEERYASSAKHRDELASLKAALREACDLAEEGWEYASDYFRDKHDSAGRIAELLKLAGEP